MNLALFDFDGTITRSDTWTPFMRFAVAPRRVVAAQVLLAPAVVGHKIGLVSAGKVRQIAAHVGFRGQHTSTVRELGRAYAATALPRTIRLSALERLDWHQSQDDDVIVVSAALDVYLGPWCNERGLAYICTTLEERDGRFTGRCIDGDCCGAEKARRILQRYRLANYETIYAYGDSLEDREMLDLAHRKYYRWKEISDWRDVTSYGHPAIHSE